MYQLIIGVLSWLAFVLGNPAYMIASWLPLESPKQTKVVDYSPMYIPDDKIEGGWCWTRSIAAPANAKAWRCQGPENTSTASGSVTFGYDPCFALDSHSVVCGIDPEKSDSGFELKLREVLPQEQEMVKISGPGFWLVRLSSGVLCTPETGTMGMTNEKRSLLYSCDDGTGIYEDGIHKVGNNYEAENVTYGKGLNPGEDDFTVSKVTKVAIKTAWR